jgi:hypothetical protein
MVKGVFMSEQQNMKVSGLAVASMILGIVALVFSCCLYYVSIPCSILGIVFAAVALKGNKGGKGMAVAGLVCSIVSFIPAFIVIGTGVAVFDSLAASMNS